MYQLVTLSSFLFYSLYLCFWYGLTICVMITCFMILHSVSKLEEDISFDNIEP